MKVERSFQPDLTRYEFDDTLLPKGYLQVDTEQDASYYGKWVHLDQRRMVCFAEGDISIFDFETDEEMVQTLRSVYQLIHIDLGLSRRPHWEARAKLLGIEDICA